MARAKTRADYVYNIKRKYMRRQAKFQKLANDTHDETLKSLYQEAADVFAKRAAESSVKKIVKAFGEAAVETFLGNPEAALEDIAESFIKESVEGAIQSFIKESAQSFLQEAGLSTKQIAQQITNGISPSPGLMKQFYAYTKQWWQGETDRDAAIFNLFGVDNMHDALQKFSEITGISLNNDNDDEMSEQERYEEYKWASISAIHSFWYDNRRPADLQGLLEP